MALMEKVVILKKGVLMFTGEHIDEERSIFDMFGWIIYFIFLIINYLSPFSNLSILHKAERNNLTLIKAFVKDQEPKQADIKIHLRVGNKTLILIHLDII